MPSGSHGGSRGSHSSGGARSSSSRSFGSSSRSSSSSSRRYSSSSGNYRGGFGGGGFHFGPRRPFRMHFGTRVYVFGGKLSLFIPLIIIAVILLFSFSGVCSSKKEFIKNIKVDYAYYHQMIAHAEQNSEYMKEGVVKDRFFNDEADRWYYTYELKTNHNMPLEGYTYSIYTNDQIFSIQIGSKIQVAVNSSTVTFSTDSVPVDFKNFNYTDDGEYIKANETLKTFTAIKIISWMLVIGSVAGMILYMVKTKKREDEEKQIEQDRAQEKHELETEALKKDLDWRCDYCGNMNKSSTNKCNNCGAGKQ